MSDIADTLKKILDENPKAMADQNIIKPLLRAEFFPDKLTGNVLGLIFESGIVDMALLIGNIPAHYLKIFVNSFVNDFGMRPNIAKKYVTIWLDALDIEYENDEDTVDDEEYENDEDNEDEEVYEDNEDTVDDEEYEDDQYEVEEDMRIRGISSDEYSITEYYGHFPLLGSCRLEKSSVERLQDLAKSYVNEYLNGRTEEFSLEDKGILIIVITKIAQNWDYNDESKFWRYIAQQLGCEADYKKIYNFLTVCVRETLQSYNRLFISDESRNAFKTTIMIHALAPKSGWLEFCNFLYYVYRVDMGHKYDPDNFDITAFINAISEQLKDNDALDYDGESYYFKEGLRNLFIYRPLFMRKIVNYMFQRIHKLLQGEELVTAQYIDLIINEWHDNLKNGIYDNVEDNVKKPSVNRKFSPKYMLENETDIIIDCPDTLITCTDSENLVIAIYIGEYFIESKPVICYDNSCGHILKVNPIHIADYLDMAEGILALRLKVCVDEEEIFDTGETLYRELLCFKGTHEVNPRDLQQGGYLFFVVNDQDLEFENIADEVDIDSAEGNWSRVVYVELDANFKIWHNGLLLVDEYSNKSENIYRASNRVKNLANLTNEDEVDDTNLTDIPIRNSRGENWPPQKYMLMDDVDRRERISISYPTSNPCELWVGKTKVTERRGKYFAIGETVAKYSNRNENNWVEVTLRRGNDKHIVGYLTKKERFIKSVTMNYNAAEKVIYWNMGGGFVGNNDKIRLNIIDNRNNTVYDRPLDLTSEIAIANVNFSQGYYRYEIVKHINGLFDDTDMLLCEGQLTIGNEDIFRFEGKRLKINKIIHYLNGKIKSEPDSINEIYIDNLLFLDREYIESEKKNCPVYEGIMFYMNENVRSDFSYAEYSTTENGKTKFFYKVNRVKITFIEKNKLIVCTADGEKLQYHRKLNRKEMQNYYRVVDAKTVSYPQNGDYGYIAYLLYSVEEEKQC